MDLSVGKYTTTQEMFLEKVGISNSYSEDNQNLIEPFFEQNGVQFVYIKRNQLYFVFTSHDRSLKPAFALELLKRVAQMIHDFCGGLEEELMRTNFILVYELIDEIMDFGYPQNSHPDTLRKFVHTQAEKCYSGTMDYLWSQFKLDKLKLTDSVSEKDSDKSIQKNTNDIFVEVQEKLSAVFNVSGFAIYIKISGMVLIKNYVHNRLNLRVQFNDRFDISDDHMFPAFQGARSMLGSSTYQSPSNTSGISANHYSKQQSSMPQLPTSQKKRVMVCQIHETINEQELYHQKMLSIFPQLGQSIGLQYQLDGNFQMLPIKLYPSFIPRHNYKKLELTLKAQCRLPTNLRAKSMKVIFKFPPRVQKVNFTNLDFSQSQLGIKDIHDMESLNKVAQQWISTATQGTTAQSPAQQENGIADVDMKKRKIVWTVNNFKGGMTKTLEVCLSYDKDVTIDELQFKQLGPFTIEFDIPNYTASGIKVSKMEAKLLDTPFDSSQKEPGKWLRHKTLSGSYVCRV